MLLEGHSLSEWVTLLHQVKLRFLGSRCGRSPVMCICIFLNVLVCMCASNVCVCNVSVFYVGVCHTNPFVSMLVFVGTCVCVFTLECACVWVHPSHDRPPMYFCWDGVLPFLLSLL